MTRILIADDQDVVRFGVRSILQSRADFEIVGDARNGREALDLSIETRPDVIVLDCGLPLLNGIEATRQIKAQVPTVEILIFTARDSYNLVRDVLEAGARGFLLKSDAQQLLIAAVESLAMHRPFFTGSVSQTLLESFLATGPTGGPALTTRERKVVQLIAEGKTNKRIADILNISTKTVEAHRATALRKLKVDTTVALVHYAISNRLVEA